MISEFNILRGFTNKRNIYIMCGLPVSLCICTYISALLFIATVSSGDSIYRKNNFEISLDDADETFPTSKSASLYHKVDYAVGYDNFVNQDLLYLDDENVIKQKMKVDDKFSKNRNRTKRLPQALIIGVKKAGTRALLEYLRLHPNVRAPGPEPHFFDKNYHKGLDWYRNLMPETTTEQLTVEKTPSYFVTKGIPERVYKMSKKTKLIIVFRDPVTRAVSDYAQLGSRNPKVKSFEEMVFVNNKTGIIDTSWNIVKIGVYAQHLAKWLDYFPINQIHFVSGENLVKNPAAELTNLQEFLGLEQYITKDTFTFDQTKGFPCYKKKPRVKRWHCLNEEKGRRHPEIETSVIKRLEDFFRPFNMRLYKMTGKDFGWT